MRAREGDHIRAVDKVCEAVQQLRQVVQLSRLKDARQEGAHAGELLQEKHECLQATAEGQGAHAQEHICMNAGKRDAGHELKCRY